mmetsp:Transcript_2908/g.8901  ORF Transcript_2908/g.8901 Transcript_2908/m.8901 type:complete len:88 (-) Transcript_2908:1668-1931(-)
MGRGHVPETVPLYACVLCGGRAVWQKGERGRKAATAHSPLVSLDQGAHTRVEPKDTSSGWEARTEAGMVWGYGPAAGSNFPPVMPPL